MENITLREWIKNYNDGKYNKPDKKTQCKAGWHDWFCNENKLLPKLNKLAPKVIWFSHFIDIDTHYVWFKNNCCNGLYDDFRISRMDNGNNVHVISPKDANGKTCWTILHDAAYCKGFYDMTPEEHRESHKRQETRTANSWRELKGYIRNYFDRH